MSKLLFALGAAMCASACFAITDDVSGLHGPTSANGGAGPPPTYKDLALSFTAMFQHGNQPVDFKLIDGTNFVRTHAIVVQPIRGTRGEFKMSIPRAIPIGAAGYRLDFWADHITNGKFDFDHTIAFPKNDHSWRLPLTAAEVDPALNDGLVITETGTSVGVTFRHHFVFVDLTLFPDTWFWNPWDPPRPGGPTKPGPNPPRDTELAAVIHIDNLAPDKMFQIRVSDPSGHVVGLYRSRGSTQTDFSISGCVEQGNVYDVDLYVDDNDNNPNGDGYDDPSKGPGNDLGWRLLQQQAGEAGLRVTFDAANRAAGNVDVGPP